jgi:hypothetical protein
MTARKSATIHTASQYANKLIPFAAGGNAYGQPNFRGGKNEHTVGQLNAEERAKFLHDSEDVDYVIYSYSTPIAWHTPKGWYRVAQKFSRSTSRQQGSLWDLR